jgi:hypothetical protein
MQSPNIHKHFLSKIFGLKHITGMKVGRRLLETDHCFNKRIYLHRFEAHGALCKQIKEERINICGLEIYLFRSEHGAFVHTESKH